MNFEIRETLNQDAAALLALYRAVAQNPRGIARSEAEIDQFYIQSILDGVVKGGLGFVVFYENRLVGEIHAITKGIRIFDHLLSSLTIGIHPDYQGKGLGNQLFSHFLNFVKKERIDIYRVELESRASNVFGIKLYERMGFIQEGRMKNQTRNADGSYEDGVMYAWINPNSALEKLLQG
jgi:ribosomal protein S18 acetylase RimI-like enzyme